MIAWYDGAASAVICGKVACNVHLTTSSSASWIEQYGPVLAASAAVLAAVYAAAGSNWQASRERRAANHLRWLTNLKKRAFRLRSAAIEAGENPNDEAKQDALGVADSEFTVAVNAVRVKKVREQAFVWRVKAMKIFSLPDGVSLRDEQPPWERLLTVIGEAMKNAHKGR
jgi:hypothetical protein